MAMPTRRSTNTVRPSVISMTTRCSRGMRWTRVSSRQSMMSQPTFIRRPAKTARGTGSRYWPRPSRNTSRITADKAPDARVRAPARMLMAVPMVAPAAGTPPMSPATMLPIPCPISSRSGLWRAPVRESATRDVSRLFTEPSRARMRAGCTDCTRKPADGSSSRTSGRPAGTCPMTGASLNHSTPSSVPAASAATGAGMSRPRRRGHIDATASVAEAMAKAW